MTRIAAVAIRLSAMIPVSLSGTTASAETMADAIAQAYRDNPNIQISRYDVKTADEGVVQARAELRPTADAQLTGTITHTADGALTAAANPFTSPVTTDNSNEAVLSVAQPLFTGGKATADRAAAEASVHVSREALRSAEGDLLLAVVTAYVDVRRYRAACFVWQQSIDELERLGKEIAARQAAGELTRTDIALAQNQLAVSRDELVTTELALRDAGSDFAALVGHDPAVLAEEPPLPQLPSSAENAYAVAEQHNPELAQARFTEESSREVVASARASGRPTISLRGSATVGGQFVPYLTANQDKVLAASIVITQSLSAGGQIASRIREAEDRNSGDALRIEQARREMVRDIAYSWNQMAASERQTILRELQRSTAATQLDGMIKEYRVGLRSTFDILYAQQSLTNAEVTLLESRRNQYIAEATLLRHTGLLEVEAIMQGVELHDPADHYRAVEWKNAVPWEGAIAALDRTGAPPARGGRIVQPGIAPDMPVIVAPSAPVPAATPYTDISPEVPVTGTVGHPDASARNSAR